MPRLPAWSLAWAVLLGACAQVKTDLEADAGEPPGTPCQLEADCPLGQTCSSGWCALPGAGDGGVQCQRSEECPPGQVCLPSEGRCINPSSEDGGSGLDGGPGGTCFDGETKSCGSSKLGECRLGVSACVLQSGGWAFGPCVGAIDPSAETCDGADNDCDGFIDDGLGRSTCGQGVCERTVDRCLGGQVQTCTPGPSSAEICDGLDNDCNGLVDDGIADLTCGVGACARTVAACANGQLQSCAPKSPSAEACNGVDDNCDGQVDEGLGTLSCGQGLCSRTVNACVQGQVQTCSPGASQTEICNGLDDDCDGQVDEGCACTSGATQNCYTGPQGTGGVGRCHGGSQTCVQGAWDTCAGEVLPGAEVCNGVDDNCNAATDDGLGTVSCGTGACRRTVAACANGQTQTCTPGSPTAEVCNGIDDDCNGTADDGLGTLSCGVGACRNTVQACVQGQVQTCTPGTPGTEVCNGVDDDCDSLTDESFPQSTQSCPTGVPGPCGTGQYQCQTGVLRCVQTVLPQPEVCGNGIDENCNGVADDPSACGCNAQVDRDLDGSNECLDCNDADGTIHPGAAELCNGKDDNCEGRIDEGFDVDGDGFSTCGTQPGGGLDPMRKDCNDQDPFVFPLKTIDCGGAATPTSPNGVDDNCNGYVDETCSCSNKDSDRDGYSGCQGDCNDGDATIHPGALEVCDGKDNDCNRATVDNCGVSEPCGTKQGANWNPWPAGTDRCRPDLVCVSNVATGALTCGSFCNQTVGTGLNDSCAVGEGCQRNLIDSDNLHLCSATPTGARSTGQTCSVDSDCRSGDCLTDGTTHYCSDKCTHEAGCSSNTTCVIERSPLGFPIVIGYDYFSYCRLDANLTGTKTVGQTCTGSECRTGPYGCFNGRCVEPCCQHSECGAGSACSIDGPKVATGYASGGTPIWSVVPSCLASTATRITGQVCTTSAQCRSGICDTALGICVDLCCNDASCPNGSTCEPLNFRFATGQQTLVRACVFSPVPTLLQQR